MTVARFIAEILLQLSKMVMRKAQEKKEELEEIERYIEERKKEMDNAA
jgi:hypothetical protein